jgi:hypothetical protein
MAKAKRTPWTDRQVQEFREWHENRLREIGYPREVLDELSNARESWIATVPTTKEANA